MGHENRFVFSKADTSIIKIEHFSSMILRKPILRSFSRTQHALILYKLGEWSSENVSYSRSPLVLAKIFPRPLKAISHSSLFDLHIFKFSMRLIVASVFATVSNIPIRCHPIQMFLAATGDIVLVHVSTGSLT